MNTKFSVSLKLVVLLLGRLRTLLRKRLVIKMAIKDKILITGGTGRLGRAARKILPEALYPTRQEMDVTDRAMVHTYLTTHQPEVIIHLAAIASIPACEK